jgi:hypothetical protein
MAVNDPDPRHEGFKAGGYFGGCCPYAPGSQEAAAWELGWAEGAARRAGARHASQATRPRWQGFLKNLRRLVPSAH